MINFSDNHDPEIQNLTVGLQAYWAFDAGAFLMDSLKTYNGTNSGASNDTSFCIEGNCAGFDSCGDHIDIVGFNADGASGSVSYWILFN